MNVFGHHCLPVQKRHEIQHCYDFSTIFALSLRTFGEKKSTPPDLINPRVVLAPKICCRVCLAQIFLDLSLSFFFSRPCVCFAFLLGRGEHKASQLEGVTVFDKKLGCVAQHPMERISSTLHSSMVEFSVHGGNLMFPQTPKYPSYQQYVSAWPWCVLMCFVIPIPKMSKKPTTTLQGSKNLHYFPCYSTKLKYESQTLKVNTRIFPLKEEWMLGYKGWTIP